MRRPSRRRCQASGGIGRRSPARVAPGILQQLRYPSEPRLDRDEISAVTFTYPEAAVDAFGIAMHWTVVDFAFTMAWAIPFARVLRVSL